MITLVSSLLGLGRTLMHRTVYATSKHFRPKFIIRGNQKLHGRDNLMNDINTNDFAYPTHIIIFHCFLRLGFFIEHREARYRVSKVCLGLKFRFKFTFTYVLCDKNTELSKEFGRN